MQEIFHIKSAMVLNKKKYYLKISDTIKKKARVLILIGLVSYFVILFYSIYWIYHPQNQYIQAITLFCSVFSILMIELPRFAELFYPSRKQVRDMTFDEKINFIVMSDLRNDWYRRDDGFTHEYILKEDSLLSISSRYTNEDIHRENFKEHWTNKFPDKNAISYYYNITYGGKVLDRIILVSVDGGKANLPLLNLKSMQVESIDYTIALMFDMNGTLDKYMGLSGLYYPEKVIE